MHLIPNLLRKVFARKAASFIALSAVCFLGLTGCGEYNNIRSSRLMPGVSVTPSTINGLYVYSFLQNNVSNNEQLDESLAGLRNSLVEALRVRGVRVDSIEANTLPAFANNQLNTPIVRGSRNYSASRNVPVRAIIQSNATREQAFGASHRLVLFPTESGLLDNGWIIKTYAGTVSWYILSTANDARVAEGEVDYRLSTTSPGRGLERTARKIISELERLHIVPPAPAGTR